MNPALLDELRETLRHRPSRISLLHAQLRDAGSEWSLPQLRLLLETYDGFKIGDRESEDPEVSLAGMTTEEALAAAVHQILAAEPSRPFPLARVMELLPSHLTSSAEQLRALAGGSSDLEIRGTMIRLKAGH